MTKKTLMFKSRDAKMWSSWGIEFDDLIQLAPLFTANQKISVALTLFKGKALQNFKEFTCSIDTSDAQRVKKNKTVSHPWICA
jgi:hypothetical protein